MTEEKAMDNVLPDWATSETHKWHCSGCGEECPKNTTWCNYFGEGRVPARAVHVRWTAEVLDD